MGSVFLRGSTITIAFKGIDGKWVQRATPYKAGDEELAEKLLDNIEEQIQEGVSLGADDFGPLTLAIYVEKKWIADRKLIVADWKKDLSRLTNHVLPLIGDRPLQEIRPKDIKSCFMQLRRSGKFAPHTIRNIYGVVRAVFRDAAVDGYVERTPCLLTKHELGEDVYSDPEAQAESLYSRENLRTLIFDQRLSMESRVLYAIGGLAGARLGEAAALRWPDLILERQPLCGLRISKSHGNSRTKTNRIRFVPVHELLAAILDEWWREGWQETYGRSPSQDDLIVPHAKALSNPCGTRHYRGSIRRKMEQDLAVVAIPKPKQPYHALRSTFITLCLDDGADDFILRKATHPNAKPRDAFDAYAKMQWHSLCREISKLSLRTATSETPLIEGADGVHRTPKCAAESPVSAANEEPREPSVTAIQEAETQTVIALCSRCADKKNPCRTRA